MWAGTRRLLLLAIGSPLRTLDRALPNATKLALAASSHAGAAEVYLQCSEAAVDHLLLEAGGPVWDETAFTALLATVKSRFSATAVSAAGVVGDVLATVDRVERRLAGMLSEALDDTVVDVQAHIARLLHRGWITAAGVDRLPDVERYARALEHRATKAAQDPARDRSKIAAVRELERAYAAVAGADRDGSVRTMLEELRVATFAQSIGARGGVSAPKARSAIAALSV
jgi:ATP-dependent helicase HrpA